MEKFIILISGLPGAGKSTFSEYLSNELCVTCVNKDTIKEIIVDTIGYKDRAENRRQSDTAFYLLNYFARKHMMLGKPVILESNFRADEGEKLKNLIDEYNYFPITVLFEADTEILYHRFMERIKNNRHHAHTAWIPESLSEFQMAVSQLKDFDPGGQRLVINTNDFQNLSYNNIYAQIRGLIDCSRLIYLIPDLSAKHDVESFIKEFHCNNETTINGCCGLTRFDKYEDWLYHMKRVSSGMVPDRLPSTTYLVRRMEDSKLIGIVDIRHYVNSKKYQMGHVGLSVIPSERSKGYGTEITAWGIANVKSRGVSKVVISCGENNEPSRVMIEKNGLEFEGIYLDDDGSVLKTFSMFVN